MKRHPKHRVTAVAVVLNEDNKILLINGPKRGWEMPAGHVEEGEPLSSAVIRETKEETGIDIEIIRFCGIFQDVKGSICSTLFMAKPIGGELRTSSESIDLGYFDIEDAKRMVTWRSFEEQIEYCIHHKDPFVFEFNQ
ncbi:NUDIX hydrolase [Paenibacillus sp. ACRRY]|uniref:NUDIX hydrolase n=1 Tax=Paenibacillus sp. ACRRY TaxID=2918208 RepID=UPI001EF4AB75|nr:NUDIX hydrolase [Paenibacillus sp. ACRRY]MCG7381992.1 NUDIX hydrolase [Paenibacillus sp. ACRRY]